MNPLQMVDLKSQYQRIKPQIDNAIQGVIDSCQFVKGAEVKTFEQELAQYLGVRHAIACGNGTDALQVALMALGLKPGDEVITTDFTFIATVEVIALLGLKPVLVDVDMATFNIDVEKVEKAITPRTKAIVPVHLFGQCANMEPLLKLAEKHGLYVVEDTAQGLGAEYRFSDGTVRKAGTIGTIGCTSFFPSKNLGCYGDGGALFTNDDQLAEQIRCLTNHGMKVRYHHDMIGVNSRLDTIQAAILRVKLPHLDEYNRARLVAAEKYNAALSGIAGLETPVTAAFTTHIFHQYTLKVKNGQRDALKKHLDEHGIPNMVYYPIPLHRQKAFEPYVAENDSFPVSETICGEVLSLPMHTELDDEQIERITSAVRSFFEKGQKG
ncbi:MAG: DegT/DnrJ/EryC1/StrS family aminotransferase [Salinivirgaceae bacterium]|nr:DegT/DnrJ/EryC1/StrS family aminotransferase [Salinivirgaceae bacterium]